MDGVNSRINAWNKHNKEFEEKQLINPFSGRYSPSNQVKYAKDDPNYGNPIKGSKTEYRGKKAGKHINAEVQQLLDIIRSSGNPDSDGLVTITFGDLFERYVAISNKLVGLLLRARKHGYVDFEGEMLFQRRDEKTAIRLLKNNVT